MAARGKQVSLGYQATVAATAAAAAASGCMYSVLQSAPCRCLASGAVQPRTCWLSASSNPSPNCFILLLQGGLSSDIAQVCSCIVLSVPMEAAKPQSLPVPSAYQSLGIQADFAPEGREHLDKEARTCSLLPYSVSLPTR